ncbi:ATP-binding protein [Sorangium sp. So ce381]|uniref:ATP-binding protein n=1 Tax=Sorangium sp. So ce381 TaxID=3133307 RepID=UPI003F5B3FAD
MSSQTYTRSGARRAGDEYQDIVALDLLVEWLEHPDRFSWFELEAADTGALDDVVALRADGALVTRQVKFSTNPADADDAWSWTELTDQRKAKNGAALPSLLQRWATSLEKVVAQGVARVDAAMVTNRMAQADIANALGVDRRVNPAKLPVSTRTLIETQLGGAAAAGKFFASFQFQFDGPGLETLEQAVRRRFSALGGTDTNWFRLCSEVRRWARFKDVPAPDGRISLTHLRNAAGWTSLRSLPQDVAVPRDYVLPSKEFHASVMQDVLARTSGTIVLAAPPGVGKSTYASYLFRRLRAKRAVLRHHYYLSVRDRDSALRLDHIRAAESLMHDLAEDYAEALGELTGRSPNPHDLRKWIEACGEYYAKRNEALVVIIDGLDHVWRERRSVDELSQLFQFLLPAPDGVVIIVATQPVDDHQLPPALHRAAPRERWRRLPHLDRAATTRWLLRHRKDVLVLNRDASAKVVFNDLAEALFDRSQGHPLHLHYTLHALQEQHLPFTAAVLRALPPCSHEDIRSYYRELIQGLPEAGREVLHLLAACPFPWPIDGLVACLAGGGRPESEIVDARRQVRHLLVDDGLGLRPFHSSILAFVEGLDDHAAYATRMRGRALEWLRGPAPAYWRWAFRWFVEAKLGDDRGLRDGPTREWAVEALAVRRSKAELDEILRRSTWANLKPAYLPRAARVGLLRDYCATSFDQPGREVLERLLPSQLELGEDPHLAARLWTSSDSLSVRELCAIGTWMSGRGAAPLVQACVRELRERALRRVRGDEGHESFECYIECAALPGGRPKEHIAGLARANASNIYARLTLDAWMRVIGRLRDVGNARFVLGLLKEFNPSIGRGAIRRAILLALDEGVDIAKLVEESNASTPFSEVYCHLFGNACAVADVAPFPATSPFEAGHRIEYDARNRVLGAVFEDTFFTLLLNHLRGHISENTAWIAGLPADRWWARAIRVLAELAALAAPALTGATTADTAAIFECLRALSSPEFGVEDGRDAFMDGHARAACLTICFISVSLARFLVASGRISRLGREAVRTLVSSWCVPAHDWVHEYLDQGAVDLDDEALVWLLSYEENAIRLSSDGLSERAKRFASLAALALRHGRHAESKRYVRESCERLLAHGYHKDMLIFCALDVIESCGKIGIGSGRAWALSLAPAVDRIRDFTDGDETRHLPASLAVTLAIVAPDMLGPYYEWQCQVEDHHYATSTRASVLRTVDLQTPMYQAFARTVVDKDCLTALEERAAKGEQGAMSAVGVLKEYLGPHATSWPPEEKSSSSYSERTPTVPPEPKDYPPERFDEYMSAVGFSMGSDRETMARTWLSHWSLSPGNAAEAFRVVSEAAERNPWRGYSAALYERVKAVDGKSAAFRWLVRAQAEDQGWERYWSQRQRFESRTAEVRRFFPERWFDFLRESLDTETGGELRSGYLSYMRFPRLVDYLISMGQTGLAARVAEEVMAGTLELIGPAELPPAPWTKDIRDEAERARSMVLSQLTWPSVMVRERACAAISELLMSGEDGGMYDAVIDWIEKQELATLRTNGLLALVRAGRSWPPSRRLPAGDLLSCLLLQELGASGWSEGTLEYSQAVPASFVPGRFFRRYVRNFLPPSYATRADRIEENFARGFWRQWGYEWSVLCERTSVEVSEESLMYWARRESSRVIVDIALSDVYRSSFLRAIAWALSSKRIKADDASYFAILACPVDLGLWRVRPGRMPAWWPHTTVDEGPIDTTVARVWRDVEDLWKAQQSVASTSYIAHASGFVAESANGRIVYQLEIHGFFQQCYGTDTPEPANVVDAVSGATGRVAGVPSFLHFAGPVTDNGFGELADRIADWGVAPAAIQVDGLPIQRWQFWRGMRGVWLPPTYMSDEPAIATCYETGVESRAGDELLGQWFDWTDALREHIHDFDVKPRTGEILEAPKAVVDRFVSRSRSRFCWAVRLTCTHRERSYQKREAATTERVFGATSLIT